MKKSRIVVAVIVFVGVVAIAGLCWAISSRNKNQTDETATNTNIDLSVLESADSSTLQPIRLPNSEEVVYIEGVTTNDVALIDAILRRFEELDGTEATEAGELAWIYTDLQPAINDWFDPDFDLIGAFSATEHTPESDGAMAWLSVPLSQNLAADESGNAFYYKKDAELGGYRMSAGYYLIGFVYSGMGEHLAGE